jgi:hypothetical protein
VRVSVAGAVAAAVALGGFGLRQVGWAAEDPPVGTDATQAPSGTTSGVSTEVTQEPLGTTVTPQAQGVEVQAAAGWADRGDDPVYGTVKVYQASVDTWAELKEALDSAGGYSSTEYVILVNGSFTMGDVYTLTDKNVVLRKTISSVVYTTTAAGEKYWDFANPFTNTNTYVGPTLYDREEDWRITSAAGKRHFIITGTNSKFVLENITLDGGIDIADSATDLVAAGTTTIPVGGGISSRVSGSVIFGGNITNCNGGQTTNSSGGGGITVTGEYASTFNMIGGVISNCMGSGDGGGILVTAGTGDSYQPGAGYVKTLNLTNTIIEGCIAAQYGGGINIPTGHVNITNTIIRNNEARVGGAIFSRNTGNQVNLNSGAVLDGNRAVSDGAKPAGWGAYPGVGGGIASFGDIIVNVYDGAEIKNNEAVRGGAGIGIQATTGTVNLYGGSFTGNKALGSFR